MLSASVPGVIRKVYVQEGERVSKGDVLVTLDRTNAQLRLDAAEAGLRMARAQEKAAKTEAGRTTRLHADNALPVAQLDQATAGVDVAQAGVAQAEVAVAMAKRALVDLVVRAPYDAVVARRMASEGEFASAMPPKMLVELQELSPIELRISIPPVDANKVQVGSPIKAYFDDQAGPIAGTIVRLSPALDASTRSLTAIVELDNTDGVLRPGLFAEVEINGEQAQ